MGWDHHGVVVAPAVLSIRNVTGLGVVPTHVVDTVKAVPFDGFRARAASKESLGRTS